MLSIKKSKLKLKKLERLKMEYIVIASVFIGILSILFIGIKTALEY